MISFNQLSSSFESYQNARMTYMSVRWWSGWVRNSSRLAFYNYLRGQVHLRLSWWAEEEGASGVRDLKWHPERPLLASVSAAGAIYLWARVYLENWSAFAPDFRELAENEVECVTLLCTFWQCFVLTRGAYRMWTGAWRLQKCISLPMNFAD